ncbi:MAG: isoprenylcysteine carboxylmethyltransferase family protein [Alphaproteobacteria bacterium]|nr:isoprenylcysteine carboxylmethyltransferase family protein [Alphaproteobacteria bacterium]
MSAITAHLWFGLACASFGLFHSLLARSSATSPLRRTFGAYYRMAYNVFATAHLMAVWVAGRHFFAGMPEFAVADWFGYGLDTVYLCGWVVMLFGLAGYDSGRLGGLRQIRNHRNGIVEPEDEPLRTDGLHRFVRHPLYSAGFMILWGRVVDEFSLATAVWGSAYLVIGTYFEGRWLSKHYGRADTDYCARVPAVIPWKGSC